MPNMPSAKKRLRQDAKKRARNRWRKDRIKQAVRAYETALHDGQFDDAEQKLRDVFKQLDRVAAKGTIHRNAADRRKGRLAKRLDRARAK